MIRCGSSCHRGDFISITTNRPKDGCFDNVFNKIHDYVGKASSTTGQDRVTVDSRQFGHLFDSLFIKNVETYRKCDGVVLIPGDWTKVYVGMTP